MNGGWTNRQIRLAAAWLAALAGCAWGACGTEVASAVKDGGEETTATVEQYYAGCYGADGQLLPGAELKAVLCKIVNTGTTTNSYGTNLDTILKTLDVCPTNEAMVQCIYLQRGVLLFNKEHLWAHGSGNIPAYSDLHHLRLSDMTMNSSRGNRDFDACRGNSDAQEKYGCWYTKDAFEPPDLAKGDIARALLYMDVRYEAESTPAGNLELVDKVGTSSYGKEMGCLSTLLDWNELDPVDEAEKRRNNLIYMNYQGNRNPFVDHPEWARRIFAPGSGSDLDRVNVSVSGLDARQRYPWNGLVDIDYEVSLPGGGEDERAWVAVSGLDTATGETVEMRTLGGMGASGTVSAGKYRMTWDMEIDAPHLVSDSFAIKMGAGIVDASYWVVDMEGGNQAEHWPIETWEGTPVGGWDLEHKTSKLVVRRIEAGTFTMGSPDGELGRQADETVHAVRVGKPFGMGVFQVTQKQWSLVMGGEAPSQYEGDARPVECVSQRMVRGMAEGTQWPLGDGVDGDSFLGLLRAKTGVAFDLPTEAQWEYACRAGTATALNNGQNLTDVESCDNLAELGRYLHNGGNNDTASGRHAEVGTYVPNAWGLFDMHGNVWEWCLDWYGETVADASMGNPVGPVEGTLRVVRGGSWNSNAQNCRSARREARNPEASAADVGFRVACPMDSTHVQRLSFDTIGTQVVTGQVALAASASGGGDVVFSIVSGPGGLDGNVLRFSGTGEVVVRARQPGNADNWPVNAEQRVTVIRAEQTMTFAAIGTQETTEEVVLEAVATSGGPVVFSVISGPGEVNGNVLFFSGEGTVVVCATQEGDDTWSPVSATQTVRVVESGRLHLVAIADNILHGSLTADVGRAVKGDTVHLTIVPEDGWKLARLTLNGEVFYGHSFVMPDMDVVIAAEFTEREMSAYWPVESERDFELGASYLVVAELPGIYTSAMRNGIKNSRIGVDEVSIGADGAIRSDSDSIVWKIRPGATEGTITLYNEEARVYAAASSYEEHYAQLLANDTSELTQWWLDFTNLPEIGIHSLHYPNPEIGLSRNYEPLNDYFANYHNYCVQPRLYRKVLNGELDVRFNKDDGFVVNLGSSDSITVSARNGTEPYSFIWSSDTPSLNVTGTTLSIPETLTPGNYTVQVVATDTRGQQTIKSINFTMGSGRLQNFDAWGRHDAFEQLSPDWKVDSGKTILNAEINGDLLISKYIEGANNDKAIELYNGTTNAVDLSGYQLWEYDNGSMSATRKMELSGVLQSKACVLVTRESRGPNPPDAALQVGLTLRTNALRFNGDDVVVLYKGTEEPVDRVGQADPNASRTVWANQLKDHTLVRKSWVTNGTCGEVNQTFDLTQWEVLEKGDFGNLGTHVFLHPAAGPLPSGYSLLLDAGATITTPFLKGGIGDISFSACAQGSSAGDGLVLAIESAPDEHSSTWNREATITIPLSQTDFASYECFATNLTNAVVRFRHLSDGTTNRIRLDDIYIGCAYTVQRTENFFAWTNACYRLDGLHTHALWSLFGRITSNGVVGPLAASLPLDSGYLRTPVFADGVGKISFNLIRPTSNVAVQVTLETSDDGGSTWSSVRSFSFPANGKGLCTNVSAWICIPTNGCARIVCNGGTADAIIDNIAVAVPYIARTLDFNECTATTAYQDLNLDGWVLSVAGVRTNGAIGNCGLINGAKGSVILSPRLEKLSDISFQFKYWPGKTTVRCKLEASADGTKWTTVTTNAGAGGSESTWTVYATNVPPDTYHYVRIKPTQKLQIYIDEIELLEPSAQSSMGRRSRHSHKTAVGMQRARNANLDSSVNGSQVMRGSMHWICEEGRSLAKTTHAILKNGWAGQTVPFRVDGRAGSGEALEVREGEWVAWDTAWVEGAARTEVTLGRPDGTVETLGGAEGAGVRGSAEWAPGAEEWGTFTLRCMSWDAAGTELGEMLALRVRVQPPETGYEAWVFARGGVPAEMPMDGDADGDGASNWAEYVADTDPWDENEVFESRLVVKEDGSVRVEPSVVRTGRVYKVKRGGSMEGEWEWLDLGPGCEDIGADLGGEGEGMGFGAMGVSVPCGAQTGQGKGGNR